MSLSEKICKDEDTKHHIVDVIHKKDIKEFIKKLKEEVKRALLNLEGIGGVNKRIDKLAGEDFI